MSKVDSKGDSEKRIKSRFNRKHKRDLKLQDLEKQLQFAESRCGTLKQQLDYIKLLYGCGKNDYSVKQMGREEGRGDVSEVYRINYCDITKWNGQGFANKENGGCPNNTKQTDSFTNTTSTNSSTAKHTTFKENLNRNEEKKKRIIIKQKGRVRVLKMKKDNKKIKKKIKKQEMSSSKASNVSSQLWQDPVVEIYKNKALKVESESGFEVIPKRNEIVKTVEFLKDQKGQRINFQNLEKEEEQTGGEKISYESKVKSCNSLNYKKFDVRLKEEAIQTESFEEENIVQQKDPAPRLENQIFEPVKSYCQPTISSKKKQVEKDIYSNIPGVNVRNIPFIAARSTAPSHNIGVNIQQVLSIMKKRHKTNGFNSLPISNTELEVPENSVPVLPNTKVLGGKTAVSNSHPDLETNITNVGKKRSEVIRSNLSHWKSNTDMPKEKTITLSENTTEDGNNKWTLKVNKLKKVLVFLHEDFTLLSQKYKKLQKKLTKRNISKKDAKDELADIERELEKKEEEIIVVIGLYKEVLNLREDFKKLQEKYNLIACGRTFLLDGLKQSNSTHTQMTNLLRKIQHFQDQLKG